jgi:SAM-dependent methyltransferase
MLAPEAWRPGQAETRESFSEKWRRAPNYREDTRDHYVPWYLERYGFRTLEGLRAFLAPKRRILDAGTAHGRDVELFASNSAARVFGIDISDVIWPTHRDLRHLENVDLVQADLGRLPFPDSYFDFISCDQVIHHTPDPYKSLLALRRHLESGGHLAFYVYRKKGPIREFCDDHVRQVTVRMSPDECMEVSEAFTKLGKALSDLHVQIAVPVDIPILEIKAGTYDLQRFIYWNVFKCYWNDSLDWTSNVITNFDWYHPLHAYRYTPDEVRAWCETAHLEIEHFDIVESGISVLARKH